jgi:hypothetical protein
VACRFHRIPLKTALFLLTRSYGLDWRIEGGEIRIE